MSFIDLKVIPAESSELKSARATRDRHCYMKGKDKAMDGDPRDSGDLCQDSRDRDCFDMGFSYGEYLDNMHNN